MVTMNDALGGLRFLNSIASIRIDRGFSIILFKADAVTDTNVQAEGQPVIDVFPLNFDEMVLRNRLTYLIWKKKYKGIENKLRDGRKSEIPVGKRPFDIVVSFSVLLIVSPLLIVVAALIRFDSKDPAFYESKRIGMGIRYSICTNFGRCAPEPIP